MLGYNRIKIIKYAMNLNYLLLSLAIKIHYYARKIYYYLSKNYAN